MPGSKQKSNSFKNTSNSQPQNSEASKESNNQNINSSDSVSLYSNKTVSTIHTFLNIVCIVAGSGTLQLPEAIGSGGWISVLIIVFVFVIAIYSGVLFIDCLYYDPTRRLSSLPEVGYAAYGIPGQILVDIMHYSLLFACVCSYIIVSGENLCKTINDIFSKKYDTLYFTIFSGLFVMVVLCCVKTIKETLWISSTGALTTLIVVMTTLVFGLYDYSKSNSSNNQMNKNEYRLVEFGNLPLTLASVSFSYAGVVVFPHVEHHMQNRKDWPKVLTLALLTVTGMYITISLVGYLAYSRHLKEYIYENFRFESVKIASRLIITIHVLVASPVISSTIGIEFEKYLNITIEKLGKRKEIIYRVILRITLIVAITVVSIYANKFSTVVKFSGALFNGFIIFIIPVFCHYKLFGWKHVPVYVHAFRLLMLITGVVCVIYGTTMTLKKK